MATTADDTVAGERTWAGFAALLLAAFLVVVDFSLAGTVVPDMVRDLHIRAEDASLALTLYLVVAASLMVVFGRLADRFGRRRLLVGALVVFGAGGIITGLASGLSMLIFGRAVQGLALGAALPIGLGVVNTTFPVGDARRTRALGLWAATIGFAAAIGPLAGGAVAEVSSWRVAFLAVVPVALLAAGLLRVYLTETGPETREVAAQIDFGGAVLLAAGMGLVFYAIDEGPRRGWLVPIGGGFPVIAVILAAGVATLAGFIVRERRWALRGRTGLLPTGLFRSRSFSASVSAAALMSFGDTGATLIVPLLAVFALDYDSIQAGFVLAAFGVGIGVGGLVAPHLGGRVENRLTAVVSLLVMAGLLAALVPLVSVGRSGSVIAGVLFAYGIAWAVSYATIVGLSFTDVAVGDSAVAGGVQSSLRLLAGALGALLVAVIFSTIAGNRITSAVDRVPNLTRGQRAHLVGVTEHSSTSVGGDTSFGTDAPSDRATLAQADPTLGATAREAFASGSRVAFVLMAAITGLAATVVTFVPRHRRGAASSG